MTIDVDSTICEVSGKAEAGAAYGHTEQLGYHPLVGVRAESGEIVHTRLRGGSSQSGNVHFVAETVARARRAGAAGELTVRRPARWPWATTFHTTLTNIRALPQLC